MTHRMFHLAVGVVFAAVALVHLARLAYELPVVVGNAWTLPLWISWPGLIITALLSAWAFHIWDAERRAQSRA